MHGKRAKNRLMCAVCLGSGRKAHLYKPEWTNGINDAPKEQPLPPGEVVWSRVISKPSGERPVR